jgi:hypothetical protein
MLAQGYSAERGDRQVYEDADALIEHAHRVGKGKILVGRRAGHSRRVWEPPMGAHRLRRPNRASLLGRIVADGKNEIELGRIGRGELIPGFRAEL